MKLYTKFTIHIILLLCFNGVANGQGFEYKTIDSLRAELNSPLSDTLQFLAIGKIANLYSEINPDSAFYYSSKMLPIAKKLNLPLEETVAYGEMGYAQLNMGNYARSLQYLLAAIAIASNPESENNILSSHYPAMEEFTDRSKSPRMQRLAKLSRIYQYTGILYGNSGNNNKAIHYYQAALKLAKQSENLKTLSITYTTLGRTYYSMGKLDSAHYCLKQAFNTATDSNYKRYLGSILLNTGRVYLSMKDTTQAIQYFKWATTSSQSGEYFRGVVASNLALADVFKKMNRMDSSFLMINQAEVVSRQLSAPDLQVRIYAALADHYQYFSKSDSVAKYLARIIKINENQFSLKQAQQFQNIDFDEEQRKQQVEAARTEYANTIKLYGLIVAMVILSFIGLILYRNNRQKQKANKVLETTLSNLKATQSQLIQSEKMASLGELTAGIAHEIQNPLNFVNNFSEVSSELVDEMNEELSKGNLKDALEIATDLKQNLEKITHHGKRAGEIVKGMLQHSRTSSGQKELTDLNVLADEYLRLAYHGHRAKDKSFNSKMETDFDPALPKIEVIPQDIGRVILNLITNAFYAVNEKAKQGIAGFEPTVSVSTKKKENALEISVKDNGNGIPEHIKEKIFQPFFTTKPTGQGTGLGLSLSYDIVKAHGGEIKVTTKENEGTEFTIVLPS